MAGVEIVIGCIGKPSVGKSTFFNAVTDGKAKTGNFPFTTIEPNTAVSFYRTECPCKKRGLQEQCAPRYGKCDNGTRFIPVKVMDVAGLVPGASEGAGLGNQFLDNLRHADVLIHIIDASGTTNEKGEATVGYDPVRDAEWLHAEIHAWVFNNLWSRWDNISRRHTAAKQTCAQTFSNQFSGYGTKMALVVNVLAELEIHDPMDLRTWQVDQVHRLVDTFLKHRFPTVLLLNKVDQGGETDANIQRILDRYNQQSCIVGSAVAEFFLKNCTKKKWIKYRVGDWTFQTRNDALEEIELRRAQGETITEEESKGILDDFEIPEPKIANRLERIKDMVLFRYGNTGVWQAVQAAIDLTSPAVAYPVRSLRSFSAEPNGKGIFGDCFLLRPNTTIRQLADMISPVVGEHLLYAEGEDGRRLAEDQIILGQQVIVKFTLNLQTANEEKRDT